MKDDGHVDFRAAPDRVGAIGLLATLCDFALKLVGVNVGVKLKHGAPH
ncbi:hypothetical protein DES47_102729 [Roseateles toxinivorans]|uniref:Uncharacterized protein n=1 Tax=Roseateles toxinivorans TaxID=270368 RepID=A0A4R6QQH7_9BURK|nr:hypothetical protein DES47_102729 [Roseateles toxinivorans]